MKNKIILFSVSLLGLVIGYAGFKFFYDSNQIKEIEKQSTQNAEIFVRDHSPVYGNPSAKVTLVEFLDPECESCRRFYPDVKELLKEYDGKVKLVVRYAPFHHNSKIAIKALEAARIQGKYWEALEMLFYYQPEWGSHHDPRPEKIFEYLPKLGLDMDKLRKDMELPKMMDIIMQDMADLRTLNVRGTPTFFVNGKPLQQFGMEFLRQLVAREVLAKYE